METQNLVISFDYSWFLAKNLAYAECRIMKFHYRNYWFFTIIPVILISTYLAWRKSHKLFEPVEATNLKVGNWSRYCKSFSMVKNHTNFCKVWIGIKWDPVDSKFKYESSNDRLRWSNFKYPETKSDPDQPKDLCKYRTYDKTGNLVLRWLKSTHFKILMSYTETALGF